MIDLYTWSTPNGRKVSIMLEECGLEYAPHAIDIGKGDQFKPEFLKISPNNRIPAIIDRDNGRSLFESGAILMYLAEKTGKFWPQDADGRWLTMQWLMWQMGGVGPMFGQVHHFVKYNQGKAPYAEERYLKEAHRLYGVLDRRLAEVEYLAGSYSIADMATWPWVSRFEWQTVDLKAYPNVLRWYKAIAGRPAVQKGTTCPSSNPASPCRPEPDNQRYEVLAMSKQAGFSGVIAPVLTPFGEDGNPDARRFADHARWLIDEGCTGLAPFGTTSEANSLGLDERMELLEELVDDGIEAAKLMPGTGMCSLADAIMLTRHAMDLGCGGVLMLPPFYYKGPSEEGLFRFFAEVIEGVAEDNLKVYLYHIPPVAQVGFSLPLIGRLIKEFPGTVVGLKDFLRRLEQHGGNPRSVSRLRGVSGL